jgi:hypothetical protein
VQSLFGEPIECIVFLFCAILRQKVIHAGILFQYTDVDLTDHLATSEESIRAARESDTSDMSEP